MKLFMCLQRSPYTLRVFSPFVNIRVRFACNAGQRCCLFSQTLFITSALSFNHELKFLKSLIYLSLVSLCFLNCAIMMSDTILLLEVISKMYLEKPFSPWGLASRPLSFLFTVPGVSLHLPNQLTHSVVIILVQLVDVDFLQMPGIRCLTCQSRGIETWVLSDKNCLKCFTACSVTL